jgi:hypothetical protein
MAMKLAAVAEHRSPFAERQVGVDADRGPFFAFGDDLEQQLGCPGRKRCHRL